MRATNSITSKQNLRGLKSNSLHIYIVKIFKIFAIMGRTRYVVRPNSAHIARISGIVERYIYSPSTLGTCDSLFSCHYPLCFLLLVFRYSIACLNMVK